MQEHADEHAASDEQRHIVTVQSQQRHTVPMRIRLLCAIDRKRLGLNIAPDNTKAVVAVPFT
jgi:hypothetical protein